MTPAPRLLGLLALLAGIGLLAAFSPPVHGVWPALAGLAAGLALLDLWLQLRAPAPGIERRLRHSVPLGVWSPVELVLSNPGARRLRLRVHDHHPPGCAVEGLPLSLELAPRGGARSRYRLRPARRGDARFAGADLLVGSPFGLWERKYFTPLGETVKVFPNFREVSRFALLASEQRLGRIGVRRQRRRGEGSEFHQLRAYRPGDSLRQIDWKASSRYQKLISREYQSERDQQLVFLLDCGRRMRHADAAGEHLDQTLNALLLLAYVAARQGDAVGLLAFGGVQRWHPPCKGGDPVRRLLEQTYDLQSSLEAADYLGAARELLSRQERRALVLLLTNARDEDQSELQQAVAMLARRHLVLVADLREAALDAVFEQPVRDLDSALRLHAVHDYLERRSRSHQRLRHQGALTLDLLPSQLPAALVNQYFEIKSSGRL